MLQVDLIDNIEQWDLLENEWDTLVAASDDDNPFRCRSWLRAWWKHFGGGQSLRILTARDDNRLVGIAPLFIDVEHFPFRVRAIRFLGGTEVCSEYLGLLIERSAEERVVPAFFDFLLGDMGREWDVIRWTDIPADSRQLAVVEDDLAARGAFNIRAVGVSNWVVQLPNSWEEFVKGHSSSRRTKIRRIRREFSKRENVEIEFAETASQFDRCWDELRTLHNRHWAAAGQSGCFADPRFNAFHTELAREYLNRGMLVLASLRLDGNALAACYGIRQGDTVYEYQRGHDPSQLRLRPGHALHFAMLERAIANGVSNWDYLRGDYKHKRDWSNHNRSCVDLTIPAPRRAQLARFYLEHAYRTTRSRLGSLRRRVDFWLHSSPG
jgi:CelD/BcsL family acetyltransferase involved in cellulose biosynthesis